MIAESLLSRLHGVRRTGPDRWVALCPSHDDGHPSLAIREIDGDRVLVHCFAGCTAHDVVAAVGLTLDALFPGRPSHRGRRSRPGFPAVDVLLVIEREALIIVVVALRLYHGHPLTAEERDRLLLAYGRILAAVQESGHAR